MQVPQKTQEQVAREVVPFYGDQLIAIKDNDGEIWAVMNDILRNIGFADQKVNDQRRSLVNDIVISKWVKIFTLPYQGTFRETNCINRRAIPLALAKISITPTMRRDQPELVSKLIRYQEECADVLYNHFMNKNNQDMPITREELSLFLMETTRLLHQHIDWIEKRDKERDASINNMVDVIKMLASNRTEPSTTQIPKLSALDRIKLGSEEDKIDQRKWLQDVWANVRKVAERTGWSTTNVFKKVYAIMDENGADTLGKYKVYHSKTGKSKINMCAENAFLRNDFKKSLLKLIKDIFPEIYGEKPTSKTSATKKISPSRKMLMVPANVKELIKEYSTANNISYTKAQFEIYGKIEKAKKVKINNLAMAYAKSNGYSNCSIGYYVSINNEMMKLLKNIVRGK